MHLRPRPNGCKKLSELDLSLLSLQEGAREELLVAQLQSVQTCNPELIKTTIMWEGSSETFYPAAYLDINSLTNWLRKHIWESLHLKRRPKAQTA